MENRQWLYYLLNAAGLSYYRENGILKLSSRPRPLRSTPDGWQDINIGYERSTDTWGNNRNFTLPQNFVLDGMEILREIFHTRTVEETVYLLIQKQVLIIDPVEYYFFHKFFYRGELDMSKGSDKETQFTASIMEGGLSKSYKAYQGQDYYIDPTDIYLKMDGVVFSGSKRFVVIQPSYPHGVYGPDREVMEMIPMTETGSEGQFFNWFWKPEASSTTDINYAYITLYDRTNDPEGRANGGVSQASDVSFHMTGSIIKKSFGGVFNPNFNYQVRVVTTTFKYFDLFILNHKFLFDGDTWTFDVTSPSFHLDAGDRFYVYITPLPGTNNVWEWGDDVRFTYNTQDVYKTTYIKAKRAINVFSDLVQNVSGKSGLAVSSLLSNKQNYAITCGDAVRGLPNSFIKTSPDSFRKFMNVVENAGIGIIQNQLYLEKIDFFLQDNNVIDLGIVKVNSCDKATDLMGSTFKIGYKHVNSDDVNGKFSFNNTSSYTLPIQRVTTSIERTTDYITDPYVIELYRANLDGKTTTDNDKDTSVIALNIDFNNPQVLTEEINGLPVGTTYYNLKRVPYASITGVPNGDKLYNIEDFSPRRLIEKHRPYLDSFLDGFNGQYIVFNTTDENRDLSTTDGSGNVFDEDSNIPIGTTAQLFKPVYFDITPETSAEILDLLEANPNRCFQFTHPENGLQYRGFNMKVGVAANSLKEEAYKLLAVANQNLTTLKSRSNG
jgi:hypothetical protein